jgi:hypothetical protein
MITGGKGEFGWPTYEECVGRIGTVTEVAADHDDSDAYHVKLKMDDNGQTYEARALTGTVEGIGLVADIDAARSLWLGNTLWYRGWELGTYGAETGEIGSLKIKGYSAVKVIDIVAGWYGFIPVRFVVQTSEGSAGFVDINPSGTNASDILREKGGFDENFLTKDPRVTHSWSRAAWSAIEGRKVFVGMTAEQVRFSWGAPEEINTTVLQGVKQEQWVYGDGNYIYLENGVVTAIQD